MGLQVEVENYLNLCKPVKLTKPALSLLWVSVVEFTIFNYLNDSCVHYGKRKKS